jgi:hypothetical protein
MSSNPIPLSALSFAFFASSQGELLHRDQRSPMCAFKAHIGFVILEWPISVPKRDPITITPHPTPTKFPIKNGPEIINFRPVP